MKKNYIYLIILISVTIVVTFGLSYLYKSKIAGESYAYNNLNKISSNEFKEYITENSDFIIYISDKNCLDYNKFEKKWIKKIQESNLLKNVIYIEKSEVSDELKRILKNKYKITYEEYKTPVIIVINDGNLSQISRLDKYSNANKIINYEVFK